jgi:hypothetical protein
MGRNLHDEIAVNDPRAWVLRMNKKEIITKLTDAMVATGIGAIGASRVHYPIWGTSLPAARSLRFWNGTELSRRRSGVGRRLGRSF